MSVYPDLRESTTTKQKTVKIQRAEKDGGAMPQQPQTRLSKKTIACIDNGLFLSVARILGESFGKVYYVTSDQSAFPNPNVGRIGVGYPEIEVCNDLFDVIDKVDMLAYFDVNRGPEQSYFRKQGMPVWGSGPAEDLELDREMLADGRGTAREVSYLQWAIRSREGYHGTSGIS